MSRAFIIAGLMLVAIGVLIGLAGKLPIRFGQLPGDITIRGKHSVFYFPLATSILVSVILSLVLWLFSRR